MKDYSKTNENVTYNDCQNCIHNFGENKACEECNYYQDCMIEKEINAFEKEQSRALDSFWDRYENGELI